MSDIPSPERVVFCISIIDIISKIALILFNLLREIKHHLKNVLLNLSSLRAKRYTADYILLLSTVKIVTVSDQDCFYFYFPEIEKKGHCVLLYIVI